MHPAIRSTIDRVPRPLRAPVELTVRTAVDSLDDRLPGLAAEVAFFVLLSLPPLLLTVVAGLGYMSDLAGTGWVEQFLSQLDTASRTVFSDATVNDVIAPTLEQLTATKRPDLLSFGLLVTIFSASRALRVVLTALQVAYDLEDHRPGWKTRLYGMGLTVIILAVGMVLLPLLIAGPGLGARLAEASALPPVLGPVWKIAYWPAVGLGAMAMLASLYHVGAPWWTPWRRDLPGAAVAMALWLAGSAGLRTYTSRTITGSDIYQPIAGPLVVLLWLYLSAFAVLLGAELNAEIEKMRPTRPDPAHTEALSRVDAAGDDEEPSSGG